jgi:putative endonuclease
MMKPTTKEIGTWGEDMAARFLVQKGYEIIERNVNYHRQGEIDIVAWHPNVQELRTLCFIEVKTRSGESGVAERATDGLKVHKIMLAARKYTVDKNIDIDRTPIQFEHVGVYKKQGGEVEYTHYVIPV